MNDQQAPSTQELSASQCWAQLRSQKVGRLGVVVDGRPEIFPLNHAVDHGSIVLRTVAGTKLAAASRQFVAFEVDGYDDATGEAWSVVVKGFAEPITQVHEVIDALELPLIPWQPGPKPHFLRIVPELLTGRRFQVVAAAQPR